MFWERYEKLCEEKHRSPSAVGAAIGISSSAVTQWKKKGKIPSGENLLKLSGYFGVSIDYILGNEEISIQPGDKHRTFSSLLSLPQRWKSLRHTDHPISDRELTKISEYLNCSVSFLFSGQPYRPENKRRIESLYDFDTMYLIFSILDICAETSFIKDLQTGISRIVLYWTDKHFNENQSLLNSANTAELNTAKLRYLYTGKSSDKYFDYGLNFTDLDVIREKTGMPFSYLLTGVPDIIRLIREDNDRKISEYKKRLEELEART